MCLISFRAHSHQSVTNLASRATTLERSKRVQRDRNSKLPMSSRAPGSTEVLAAICNLGSGAVPDCPAEVQTWMAPKPSFTPSLCNRCGYDTDHDTRSPQSRLHARRRDFVSCICTGSFAVNCVRTTFQTSVRSGFAASGSQSSTWVAIIAHRELLPETWHEPMHLSPTTLLFSTIHCATVQPRMSLLLSQAHFVQLLLSQDILPGFCRSSDRTRIVTVVPQHMQSFVNCEPSAHNLPTSETHDEISTKTMQNHKRLPCTHTGRRNLSNHTLSPSLCDSTRLRNSGIVR